MSTLSIVNHTHWDREWHAPYSRFRAQLLLLIGHTLDLLERDELRHFTLDGQTVILEDIRGIRPDYLPRLLALNKAGKLSVGPFYTLPDQALVSGEALIRNLFMGRRAAPDFDLMPIGYAPDTFGHAADLPRILQGFGIDTALVWRGAPPDVPRFWWCAPDSSAVLAINQGYYQPDVLWDADAGNAPMEAYLDQQAKRDSGGVWLLLNGGDHLAPRPHIRERVAAWAQASATTLIDESLPEYVKRLNTDDLPTLGGELRDQPGRAFAYLLPGTLSARVSLKLDNVRVQTLLQTRAEPWLALAMAKRTLSADHAATLHGLLHEAWREALKNQAHDSICGCSDSAVIPEMQTRTGRAIQLGEAITEQACLALIGEQDAPEPDQVSIAVWAAGVGAHGRRLTTTLDLPPGKYPVRLIAPSGESVPFRWQVGEMFEKFVWGLHALPQWLPGRLRGTLTFSEAATGAGGLSVAVYRLELGDQPPQQRETIPMLHTPPPFELYDEPDYGDTYNFSPAKPDQQPVHLLPERTPRGFNYHHPDGGLHVSVVLHLQHSGAATYRITVENHRPYHRLRLYLTRRGDLAYTDNHFSLTRRAIRQGNMATLDPAAQPNIEAEAYTFPMSRTAIVSDGAQSTQVITAGLHEVEFIRHEQGTTLALTLLRAVGWLSRRDLITRTGGAGPIYPTPDAQSSGSHTFDVTISEGKHDPAAWWQAADAYTNLPYIQQLDGSPRFTERTFLQMESDGARTAITAIKPLEDTENAGADGLIVRVLNPDHDTATVQFKAEDQVLSAQPLRLDETPTGDPTTAPHAIKPLNLSTFRVNLS
jgi:mannosylglycerate hydrolase